MSRLVDGAQYYSAHRLADLFAGTDALVAKDVTANSRLAYHLHTIVLKMVEALRFTSAATAGLRQDILRFHQGQPYSEARSHVPKSSAATTLRLSWNGRPVNLTLLLALLLADAISTLYRLTLDSRGTSYAPTGMPHPSATLDCATGLVGYTHANTASPHLQLLNTLKPYTSGWLCSCYQTVVRACFSAREPSPVRRLGSRTSTVTA